jgi:hypothetical protein
MATQGSPWRTMGLLRAVSWVAELGRFTWIPCSSQGERAILAEI